MTCCLVLVLILQLHVAVISGGANDGWQRRSRRRHPRVVQGRAFMSGLARRVGVASHYDSNGNSRTTAATTIASTDAVAVAVAVAVTVGSETETGTEATSPPAWPIGGRVSVTSHGADPTGVRDSTRAIQAAIDAAWVLGAAAGYNLTQNGVPDLGGLTIDFEGGHYLLSAPLQLPPSGGGNIVFSNGALHASATTFPTTRFLLEFSSLSGGGGGGGVGGGGGAQGGDSVSEQTTRRYRYLTFENLEFDGAHRAAGGLLMQDFEEIRMHLCLISGYSWRGLWARGIGNELFVDECWFREHKDARLCHASPNTAVKTGTAIQLDNNDHSVTNSVVACSRQGIVVNGSATVVSGLHVYTEGATTYPLGCAHVTARAAGVRFEACYFDGCPTYVDAQQEFELSGSLWLLAEGDASPGQAPLVLTPTGRLTPLQGVLVRDNVVVGGGGNYSLVLLNESARSNRTFDHDTLRDVVIEDNTLTSYERGHGTQSPGTRAATAVTIADPDGSAISVDVGSRLLFKPQRLPMILYSLSLPGSSPPIAHVLGDSVGANSTVITVRASGGIPGPATLRVWVDVSSHDGAAWVPSATRIGANTH